jgi:hypothetical protein
MEWTDGIGAIGGVADVTGIGVDELVDRWVLPVENCPVASCSFDYAVTLRLTNDVNVRIEQPFVYRSAEGVEHLIVPGSDPVGLAPVLSVCRLVVRQGFAFKDGRLELEFEDGSSVNVPSGEDFEPWELFGPGDLRVISVPGGDLAIWSAQST